MSILNFIKQCKSLKQVHQIHAYAITSGLIFLHPSAILNAVLSTFTSVLKSSISTSSLNSYALSLFHSNPNPSTFSYNSLIRFYTLLSSPHSALQFFTFMCRLSVPPDFHTYPSVLKACAQTRALSLAKSLHCHAFKHGFAADLFVFNSIISLYSVCDHVDDAYKMFVQSSDKDVVSYNAMVDGFIKSRQISRARELFDLMPVRDDVSWGTMIAGYAQTNWYNEAIVLFHHMLDLKLRPDNIALVSALSACAQLGDLEQGRAIHEHIKRNQIRLNSFLSTGLVDMYAKCGCIEVARDVFESSLDKSLYTWNAMLAGLAMHGYGSLLLEYFSRMIDAGIKPDGVSFLAVLVGCNHAGLVFEAEMLFDDMETVYGVHRERKHYGCMADTLGKAGLFDQAIELIKGMPMEGDIFVWGGLLGGCRIHGNVDIAKKVAEQVMELKPDDGGVYSIMANMYANTQQWDDLVKIRGSLSANKRVKKITGFSSIKLNEVANEHVVVQS